MAQRDALAEAPDIAQMHTVGTIVTIKQVVRLPDENVRLLVEGERRAALVGIQETGEM